MTKKVPTKAVPTRAQTVEQAMSLAWQAYGEGRPREAETICAQLVKARPEHAHAWFLRGMSSAAMGKPKVALKHFEKVVNAPDLLPPLAQARGRAFMALEQIETALDHFQEALRYKADDASTYYLLGLAKLRQSAPDDARRFFRQCTLMAPKFGPAHYELGVMALNAGNAPQAVASFATAVESMPKSPEAANNLGLAHQAAGDATAAEKAYRKAVALNKDYAEAWFNLGTLLRKMNSAKAEACLKRAFDISPDLRAALAEND